MLHGCYGCSQLVFMRLTNYKNELETKHHYHAFIMQMCIMNICVVCFLHTSCSRLIRPVEMYTKMVRDVVPQKRYVLQGTYPF